MEQIGRKELAPGETWELPDGLGSITFDGLAEFGNFQVARDPGRLVALVGAVAAIVGVMASLLIQRRRVWVRASPDEQGRTLVTVAGLARTDAAGLGAEVDRLAEEIAPQRQSASSKE